MADEVTAMNIPEGTNMRYFTVCTPLAGFGAHRVGDHRSIARVTMTLAYAAMLSIGPLH